MEEKEPENYVVVKYKQSSSSGKLGYDIDVKCSTGAEQKEMRRLADLALEIAKGCRERL